MVGAQFCIFAFGGKISNAIYMLNAVHYCLFTHISKYYNIRYEIRTRVRAREMLLGNKFEHYNAYYFSSRFFAFHGFTEKKILLP